MKACKGTIKPEPTCVEEKELVIGLEEFNKIKNKKYELCDNTKNDDGRMVYFFKCNAMSCE